jgi:hypothetical protein
MTEDGEMATWRGQGVGRFTGRGRAVSYRGAIYYQTTSERLARLNGIAVVFEYDSDEAARPRPEPMSGSRQLRPLKSPRRTGRDWS